MIVKIFTTSVIILEIIFIILLAFLFDLTTPTKFSGEIYIQSGSIKQIITNLPEQKINKTAFDPYILAKIGTPKEGYLDLGSENLSKIDLFYALTKAKPIMENITLIPGETTIIFLQNLANKYGVSLEEIKSEYNATSPFYEGFLIPQTYSIAKGKDAKSAIKQIGEFSLRFHNNLAKKYLNTELNSPKWQEILIKASIIQKEAANIDEMPLVASVIENRLAKNMKLQMDGTLNYGIYSHTKVTPKRIKDDNSSYNTYLNEGLPKSPICTVSKEAILAALNPAKTDYLYFMLDRKSGGHKFSKTYNEHLKEVINSQK